MSRAIISTLGIPVVVLALTAAPTAQANKATSAPSTSQNPAPQTSSAARAQAAPTDSTLKDRIKYKLETDAMVRKYDVDVKVDNAVATLSGTVATDAQKAEAARVAKVDGVKNVVNEVKVDKDADKTLADRTKNGLSKTGETINDAWITTKVKWFFLGEDLLKGSDINVDTNNHVVTLKGTVKSQAGKTRAVQLARDTDGVQRVVDELTIK